MEERVERTICEKCEFYRRCKRICKRLERYLKLYGIYSKNYRGPQKDSEKREGEIKWTKDYERHQRDKKGEDK